MPRKQQFFRGLSEAELTKEVRLKIAAHYFREVFTSELISDLIAEKHYFCSVHGLRPQSFRKMPRVGGGYDFEACFNGRWHGVSWTKCLDAWTDNDWLVRALRDSVRPVVATYKVLHPVCERCQQRPSEETDHVRPEFKVLAAAAIATLSEDQIRSEMLRLDWWDQDSFRLSEGCPAVSHILEAHKTAILQAVCKQCHLKNSADRRTAR